MVGCRAEGNRGAPSYYFKSSQEVSLIGCTNEGKIEKPCNMYFEDCQAVTLVSPGISTSDIPYVYLGAAQYAHPESIHSNVTFTTSSDRISIVAVDEKDDSFVNDGFDVGDVIAIAESDSNNGTFTIDAIDPDGTWIEVAEPLVDESNSQCQIRGDKWSDGIQFVACDTVKVIAANAPGSYSSSGDRLAKAVRIDADCREIDMVIRGTDAEGDEVDIDPKAINCHVAYTTPLQGTRRFGQRVFNDIAVGGRSTTLNWEGVDPPTGIVGHAIARGANADHVGFWWDEHKQRFVAAFDEDGAHEAIGPAVEVQVGSLTFASQEARIRREYDIESTTLASYTADAESQAYTGTDNLQSGSVYAKVIDLNALRVAFENERARADSLAQVLAKTVKSLQDKGIFTKFSPLNLPGIQLWLRGDKGVTIDTGVSVWANQAGSNDITQTIDERQPTLNVLGGQVALNFDGTDDYLGHPTTGLPVSDVIAAASYTMFIVFSADAVNTNKGPYSGNDGLVTSSSGVWGAFLRSVPEVVVGNYDGSADEDAKPFSIGQPTVAMLRHAGGKISIAVDGGTETTPVASGDTTFANGRLEIGRSHQGTAYFDGKIAEVIVCNTSLSAADTFDTVQYLRERYGIT